MQQGQSEVGSVIFLVGNDPYCAWCTKDTNAVFLRGVDTDYFHYLAKIHGEMLGGENKQKAAIALRTAYYHGLETLFMLMFAALQAPYSVAGWLVKCQSAQLRKLVNDATSGELNLLSPRWKLEKMSWDKISALIIGRLLAGRDDAQILQNSFTKVWSKFAADFTKNHLIDEYNSFKHGFRATVGGGPSITLHTEQPSEVKPMTLASNFGSSFFAAEKLTDAKAEHLDHHFTLKYCHVNLNPDLMVAALCMISVSIKNLVAFLLSVNGCSPESIQFALPANQEIFDVLTTDSKELGYEFVAFNLTIHEDTVSLTKQQITERLISSKAKKS